MDLNGLVLASVEIVTGLAIVFSLFRERRTIALGIGGSVVLFGLVILMLDFAIISLTTAWIIMGLALLSLSSFFYVAVGKGANVTPFLAMLLAGVFFLPLVQVFVFHFPTAVIFAYGSVCISIMDSYRKSRTVVTSNLGRVNRYSRVFVLPFARVERVVRTRYKGMHVRGALFGTYMIFEMGLLLALPFLLTVLVGEIFLFEVLSLLIMWIIISTGWRINSVPA